MPYTQKQKRAAGAELSRRRKGQKPSGPLASMTRAELEHAASKASGTRKKKGRKKT